MFRASAGVAEHCIMYPVDVVKTRMQALACNTPKFQSKSVVRNILFMMREEGFWRPVQGVQAMALGAGPAHAMYFLSYETMKERLAPKFKQVTPFQFSLNDLLFIVDCSGWCPRVHDAPPGWLWCHLLSRFCDDPSWGIDCRRDRKMKRSQLWENSIVPFWCQVIKQRMQMCCSPFKNATSAFRVRTFFWSNFHRLSGQFF